MLKAKDLMQEDLTAVQLYDSLSRAAKIMSGRQLSGLPVVDPHDRVIGFISERDIIIAAFPECLPVHAAEVVPFSRLSAAVKRLSSQGKAKISDFISPELFAVNEDTPIFNVTELLLGKGIKRLPVLRQGRLVGVIERASLSQLALEEGV
ncbi:MAG: CBS domain-containing protein [Candidatus Saganbacteria bacterium]|nr:CBS domain-containing protein [Candidatus Saganbacteria bacterium]